MPHVASLLACLNAEAAEISAFISLLEQEAAALTEGDAIERISALTEAKESAAQKLADLARERENLLLAIGDQGGHAGMERAASAHSELGPVWEKLLAIAEEARSLNQRNGALIDIHLRHTQRSLEAMRAAAGIGNVYTADGRPHAINRSKRIAAG